MTSGDTVNLIWLIGALVLVVSAISVRRIGLGSLVRAAFGWAAIVLVAIVAVAHRYEIAAAFATLSAKLGIDEQRAEGSTLRIRMSPDGHFWARVRLNGIERRMLIDSGATITAISQRTAEAAGVNVSGGLPAIIETANGSVTAHRGTIESVAVGPVETRDLGVVVAQNFGDLDVLGMNFLSRLHSWRVEGKELVLEPVASGDGNP
ncbi:retropepsin-like aspartic protease family protein [Sphingomonas sp. RS6]